MKPADSLHAELLIYGGVSLLAAGMAFFPWVGSASADAEPTM